ncbi:hypothetical protein F3J27_11000 [Enterobacter sp. Ap-916]|uniref:Uncharacterized protein n=1 Tax=Cedecea neteri TaxID=158822 RepID=A0AAN0VTL3_9ENTR|nr:MULTISPECIES: hypothetical protein [Enterobacteriaceae]NIG74463.1 hypothetical protein [Klebsiella sp. Ap-873]AIR61387.1 hypothetical protein LH23_12200 [Cedecea neteri]AIR65703.1 hypothetical protein LH86_11600 [Cedecea neteri]EJF29272.1 hypothetical protein A936_19863 [Enterobacter sp. Ag1]NIF48212.1 hypothetical protein [Enterobacter sp. Ap-1006]
MASVNTGNNAGASSSLADSFQSQMDSIENKSMQDSLDKAERDRKNAYVSGYQNSATTMISSLAQNKISF